jgi:predicted 3-demethylubiquinone-9 3-methyltransferase (glyoxalase superfamily)
MITTQKITPNLWFSTQAEEAVNFYRTVFRNSAIGRITRYGKEGFEIHRMPEGTILTIEFQLEGQQFVALNGGPVFKFNEAISFIIN